jgi:hypothetical protein
VIATAIITAPRPKPTLYQSVTSMLDAGFSETYLVSAEPGCDELPPGGTIFTNTRRLGNFRNWYHAMQLLINQTDAPFLLMCEDDIAWARNAHAVLEKEAYSQRWDGCGMMSLYTPNQMAKMFGRGSFPRNGWHGLKIGFKMWGAQALLFPRTQALELMTCDYFNGCFNDPKIDKNVDGHIAESMLRREKAILYRIPCLVDHSMGDRNSSIYGDKDRPSLRTNYFKERA